MPRLRPSFRFSLRTLFIVLTLLSVWLGYHWNWIRQRRETLATGRVEIDPFLDKDAYAPAPRLLGLLGEPGYPSIYVTVSANDLKAETAELAWAKRLFPEANIRAAYLVKPAKRAE